ncbi:FHA domain-containing protein FhaB/FipA [Gephyromycinifex aptenodytis]|uniref:FHA domain-containing protein FhaB/FipA n=1 Tax=Gephyromycinifex aptenodytis TaxID=2716227 RepID=UPI001444E5CF|nr:FHA domain-containing protein [Gephyromycinifex aptenodytis]
MSELTLTAVRFGLLAMLWLFVFSIVGVIRSDLFGTRIVQRGHGGRSRVTPTRNAPRPRGRRTFSVLAVVEGSLRGTTVPLKESGVLLGRNPECTLVLDDDFASGRHARIYFAEKSWYVEDLDSTNGTYVGGERIDVPTPLREGTQLRIGTTVLELGR